MVRKKRKCEKLLTETRGRAIMYEEKIPDEDIRKKLWRKRIMESGINNRNEKKGELNSLRSSNMKNGEFKLLP